MNFLICFLEEHTPKSEDDGSTRINEMRCFKSQELGRGSLQTVVYRGYYGKRKVDVIRVTEALFSDGDIETALLLESDEYRNIVRYNPTEKCDRHQQRLRRG